ncbi:MAG TPA: nitroreductase family deazaflavin-dependent oxidoreductase, partial [Thermomicrobiales bacterium]|nr:nitroreductase family deazaflavin-dependent oxidoreductase [Thermomicrobiales bacterium]
GGGAARHGRSKQRPYTSRPAKRCGLPVSARWLTRSFVLAARVWRRTRAAIAKTARRAPGGFSKMPLTGTYEPSPSDWAREQVERFEASGGREGNTMSGMSIVVLTSVGAKSGKLRKTPLMRVEHNGQYAVVASLGGAPNNPAWHHNLKKNPHVELQDGAVKRDYLAREATGPEKAAWWERAVAAFPNYADYQSQTTREIPVFVLTPLTEANATSAPGA